MAARLTEAVRLHSSRIAHSADSLLIPFPFSVYGKGTRIEGGQVIPVSKTLLSYRFVIFGLDSGNRLLKAKTMP